MGVTTLGGILRGQARIKPYALLSIRLYPGLHPLWMYDAWQEATSRNVEMTEALLDSASAPLENQSDQFN
jgi:hypothetical protein